MFIATIIVSAYVGFLVGMYIAIAAKPVFVATNAYMPEIFAWLFVIFGITIFFKAAVFNGNANASRRIISDEELTNLIRDAWEDDVDK